MECRDRFFMMAVELSFTGEEPHFEAVDETGVYPITEQYAAECGYSVSVLPLQGHVELRASYFSCHTDNKDDKVFTFNFNLIANHSGEVTYTINKTCSPSLPWSPREVTCEVNYMEPAVEERGYIVEKRNATVQISIPYNADAPPEFDAICSESGIRFRLDHRPFNYLWYVSIGSDLLTSELAAQRGYIMSNNSQSLLLEVPLFTHGYEYKCVQLMSMTRKADLSLAVPSGGIPTRTNLIDKYCGPKEADDTRALFSLPVNSCGSIVKLGKENVTYQNEIFYGFSKYLTVSKAASEDPTERVIVECTYPLAGLHRLFSVYRFESDTVGVGRIIHTTQLTAGSQIPTIQPTTALQTTPATTRPIRMPIAYLAAIHPPARYIKVSRIQNLHGMRKGEKPDS
ncbi:uncharacterized protein AKAME5_002220800 [Lates japonicus]|uniref:ZP-N domain-containing protein n=1 Tax=Lates japonicus TaxID=270547 RepID=A0AAD3RHP2_LATJO|nr:uncharacterized protein AKAME5_002220800 [Lates japonicus]